MLRDVAAVKLYATLLFTVYICTQRCEVHYCDTRRHLQTSLAQPADM